MFDVVPVTSEKQCDCGPTCLKMLLEFYDISADLDDLIKECNVTLRGCTAGDLKRVGNAHGLDIKAWDDKTPALVDRLINQDRPAIVWWKFNHFCVFCGKDENGDVVICNPDKGRYSLSEDSFKSLYSGVSITHGVPEDIPEEEENEETGVTLSDEQAQEYTDLQEIAAKIEEVF